MIFLRILITGARSGIGFNLGKELVNRGHCVYFSTHTINEMKSLKKKLKEENIDALCFKMDISTNDINLVDSLKIDVLICNAAIGIGGSVLDMDTNDIKCNYDVNVFSTISLIKKVYNNMKNDNIDGKIFVISSLAGYFSFPFLGSYSSCKMALSTIIKSMMKELKYLDNNISVSLVELGAYKTGFNQVMIDNKEKYGYYEFINKKQRNMFSKIENKNFSSLNNKLIKNIESSKPKQYIRVPLLQSFVAKIYFIFH